MLKHPRDIRWESITDLLRGRFITEVVRPFRERGARLPQIQHHCIFILSILVRVDAQKGTHALLHELRREFRETLWGRRGIELRQRSGNARW